MNFYRNKSMLAVSPGTIHICGEMQRAQEKAKSKAKAEEELRLRRWLRSYEMESMGDLATKDFFYSSKSM